MDARTSSLNTAILRDERPGRGREPTLNEPTAQVQQGPDSITKHGQQVLTFE